MTNQKKAGIITFHAAHNCGSILQAYALQEVLRQKLELDAEIIDFVNEGQRQVYAVIRPIKSLRDVAVNASRLLLMPKLLGNKKSYEGFIKNHLKLSPNSYGALSDLEQDPPLYDYYVSGSDQVWNVTIADSDEAYFLPFIHDKPKIAYAVSQGAKDIGMYAKDPAVYQQYIKDYSAVSVRENNGQSWIETLTGLKPEVTLDPTLLLGKGDYTVLEEPDELDLNPGEYIFVYASPFEAGFERIVQQVSERYDLPIVVWHPNIWFKTRGALKGYKMPKEQNPGKYLHLIKNAKLVFTASFHGVIFSTIYEKDFWIFRNEGMKGVDDRIRTLVDESGLSDRFIDDNFDTTHALDPVDYSTHRKRLTKDREGSMRFLTSALKK